ncbi:MAG TPA: DUF3536 domain-containing protein, partial [Longimicrobiales bacterium]|nr:DUF3536 domain-containing protein [Longimicrobiales bacterium]
GERVRLTKLLELQRHAMLMYTSCGWFFDELSGIETVQVIQYAGRAIQLAQEVLDLDVEDGFLDRLEAARSNLPEMGTGRDVYLRAMGARVGLVDVGAHFAISSLFEEPDAQSREYCYDLALDDDEVRVAGRARLATGRITVTSRVTKESLAVSYGVLHLGDHTIQAGVRPFGGDDALETMRQEVTRPFDAADFTETIRTLDRHFPDSTYNLKSLFHDQRRQVLDRIIQSTLRDTENEYRQIYERNAPLMNFLNDLSIPMPPALALAGEYVLNISLIREVSSPDMDLDRVRSLMEDAHRREILLDTQGIGFALQGTLERLATALASTPDDLELLQRLEEATGLVGDAPFEVNTWAIQNAFYDLRRDHSGTVRARAAADDERAQRWLETFRRLGERLRVAVD